MRVLEAWALELLGISHIRMQENVPEKQGGCIDILCCEMIYHPGINGEAYPKTDLCPQLEGMAVYYVIQVAPGKEVDTELYITKRVEAELYSSCFHPVRQVRKKFHGEWKDKHEKLLPGYVFINSENAEELYLALKSIPMLTKFLGWNLEYVTALNGQETEWLEAIVTVGRDGMITGEVPLSQIEVNENDEIKILSGPLQNMEGIVRRINLHKRIAEVEVEFMRRKTVIHLGIEMVEKK